nr:putative reverse transcriptase domain-containing protein [Tanacetum cinerariifolium]
MIDQGVTAALAARDANRNGDDSHTSGTGRPMQVARECTYPDFLKCQPLNFKGIEGVVGLKIDKVKRYVGGLPDMIHGSVMADNKRKSDDTTQNNHRQPNKRQNTRRAYATGNGDRRAYEGPRPLCIKFEDKVMLKVSPWKGVVRFGKQGKLNPMYVGPFKVLEEIGKVAYKLDLPKELSRVHNTFHVPNLKKCHVSEPLAIQLDGLHFDDKFPFVEEPVEIVDREVKRLKRS